MLDKFADGTSATTLIAPSSVGAVANTLTSTFDRNGNLLDVVEIGPVISAGIIGYAGIKAGVVGAEDGWGVGGHIGDAVGGGISHLLNDGPTYDSNAYPDFNSGGL